MQRGVNECPSLDLFGDIYHYVTKWIFIHLCPPRKTSATLRQMYSPLRLMIPLILSLTCSFHTVLWIGNKNLKYSFRKLFQSLNIYSFRKKVNSNEAWNKNIYLTTGKLLCTLWIPSKVICVSGLTWLLHHWKKIGSRSRALQPLHILMFSSGRPRMAEGQVLRKKPSVKNNSPNTLY